MQSDIPEVVKDTGASFVMNPWCPEDGRTGLECLRCSNGFVFSRDKLSWKVPLCHQTSLSVETAQEAKCLLTFGPLLGWVAGTEPGVLGIAGLFVVYLVYWYHNTVPPETVAFYILFQHPHLGFHFLFPVLRCPPVASLSRTSFLPSPPLINWSASLVFQKHDFIFGGMSVDPPSQQICTECQLCAKPLGLYHNKIYIVVGELDTWPITTQQA